MENAEEILQCLEEFSKRRPKVIPRELEDYLQFVARTGDPVYQWALVKNLFKEKFLNVITEFYETSPGLDIPHCPNVDVFNYETMKNALMEKIDTFSAAPFTIQRISELLTSPRRQYSRIDKFMRAFEKNILVVSTREPGPLRHTESENGEAQESMVNGSDSNSDYNVDVDMEDMSSWKENTDPVTYAVQSSSSNSSRSLSEEVFASQNGPVEDQQPEPHVELMTVEPDSNNSPTAESSDSSLSPPEIECKKDDIDAENSEKEATCSTSIEDISPTHSNEASEVIENKLEEEQNVNAGSVKESEEVISTTDDSKNITDADSKCETENLSHNEKNDLESADQGESLSDDAELTSADDESQESTVASEPMESQEEEEVSNSLVPDQDNEVANSTEMETIPTEVIPILEPSVIITEEPVTLPVVEPSETEKSCEDEAPCEEQTPSVALQVDEASESQSSEEDKETSPEPANEDLEETPMEPSDTDTDRCKSNVDEAEITEETPADVVSEKVCEEDRKESETSELAEEKLDKKPTETAPLELGNSGDVPEDMNQSELPES